MVGYLFKFRLSQLIDVANAEARSRRFIYGHLDLESPLSEANAQYEIQAMQEIVSRLEQLQEEERDAERLDETENTEIVETVPGKPSI